MWNSIRPYTAVLGVGALAVAFLLGSGVSRDAPARVQDDPVKAVKNFLTDATVDHNGYQACGYMTSVQQLAAARRAGTSECREAFDHARLTLGGNGIATVHGIAGLSARSQVRGDRAWVRLTRHGQTVEFRLVKANAQELEEFLPPTTSWRIAAWPHALIPPEQS